MHIRLKKPSAAPAASSRAAADLRNRRPSITKRPLKIRGRRVHGIAAPASDVHVIKSPIVGTFYAAPSPRCRPVCHRGAKVEPGQVLCIIEAMKLMNEIESDVAGEVAQIFVENGKPVEYGEPLFGIRARGKK